MNPAGRRGTIAAVDSRDLLAGRYRLATVLGRGGMGAVHRAHDQLLDRDVAVKLLDVAQAPDAAVQRFRREAQFLAGLAHPNVVTVFDFGTDESQAWLVMELLAGPTLQDLVNQRGPLPIEDVRRYAGQCAAALAAAHAAGITHRDVKPANLMLAADGTCKLLDLGIARLDGAVTTQPALTQAGTILGTVPYLAPEVITGEAPQPPADLYALGGVMFALLTAHPPFAGEDLMAAMAQHVHAPVPHPAAMRADVPPELDALVVGLLAKDPAARPTATEVVAALDGSPSAAVAPTVALAGTAAAGSTQLIGPPRTDRAAPHSRTGLIAAAIVLVLALIAVVLVVANSGNDTSGTAANGINTGPTHRASRSSSASRAARPSVARRTPRPATLTGALAALRSAITSAEAGGGLSAADATDLVRRVDAMTAAAAGGPAGPPGHGKGNDNGSGNGNGNGNGGGPGGGTDITPQLDDFAHHLADLRQSGRISGSAYSSITSALNAVRSFAGSSGGGGGDGGD